MIAMKHLVYVVFSLCLMSSVLSTVTLMRSCTNEVSLDAESKPTAKEPQADSVASDSPRQITVVPSVESSEAQPTPRYSPKPSPTDPNSPTNNEPVQEARTPSPSEVTKSSPTEASPANNRARQQMKPILEAIALQSDNKPLRASLISDIRRAGVDAVQASMPELIQVLETDDDPQVRLVLISTLATAPRAVPQSAAPLINRIVQSVGAQRELRDQGAYLLERMQSQE